MPTHIKEQVRIRFQVVDLNEPAHVHIRYRDKNAKFWLDPVKCERPGRLTATELNQVERVLRDNQDELIAEWNELTKEAR